MTEVRSIDPRNGRSTTLAVEPTSPQAVDAAVDAAARAGQAMAGLGRAARATLLRTVADALEERRAKLVEVADRETALGPDRLHTELHRTIRQLRLFADVVDDGSFQEITATTARPAADPPVPDLRRMLIPVGPVVVFCASNFPFAFSVLGGDTASALAAGCPVLVKAHSGHPETSLLALAAWRQACTALDWPDDALQLVFGRPAGLRLVAHPSVCAVGFTGSVEVGRQLHDLAARRRNPIPFYGELAGVNPLVVTAGAAASRADEIGHGVAASYTQNGGQFCTKPGLVFVPRGTDGDRLVRAAAGVVTSLAPTVLLTSGTRDSYADGLKELSGGAEVRTVASASAATAAPGQPGGFTATPTLLEVDVEHLTSSALRECFGPVTMIVRYESLAQVIDVTAGLEGALAGAIHAAEDESDLVRQITAAILPKVGRVVFDGYPTGVAVTAAMTHGGPWPATTNALHSSVGPTAMRRFLRPVTYQNAPRAVLPVELRDIDPLG